MLTEDLEVEHNEAERNVEDADVEQGDADIARTPKRRSPSGSSASPAPSLREEQKRLTKTKLLEAARAVFREKGYAAATIDDIVDRAGASRGTYYLYYRNKIEVVEELLEDFNDRARDLARRLALIDSDGPGESLEPSFETWITSFVNLYREHRLSIRAWIQAEGSDPALHRATDRNMNEFLEVLTDRIGAIREENGVDRDVDHDRIRATLMLVQLERFCYFWMIRGWKVERAAAIPTIARLWHSAVYSDVS